MTVRLRLLAPDHEEPVEEFFIRDPHAVNHITEIICFAVDEDDARIRAAEAMFNQPAYEVDPKVWADFINDLEVEER